jgi:hypothetical protein
MLTACLPGVVIVSVMFSGAPLTLWSLRLMITGLLAATAWASTYFQGIGYARSGDVLEAASSPDWVRLAAVLGPIPAALEMIYLSFHPPRHPDAGEGVFPIACLAWIPVLHLELVRLWRRRSNNRWSGP